MTPLTAIHWNTNPEIVSLFGTIPLTYYGILFTSGIALAYFAMHKIFRRENMPAEELDRLALYVIIGTVLGARLGHFLFYQPEYFWKAPLEVILPIAKINGEYRFAGFQGLASHGGAIGILIALLLYVRKTKVNFLWLLDRIAIVSPIPCGFIRLGNFMNSEIIGKPTHSDYGVVFELIDSIPRHPAQLYEAFSYFLIFLILVFIYRKYQKPPGFIFGVSLTLLCSARFLIEFFKEDQVAFEQGMALNMGQWLSVPFILAGMIWILISNRLATYKA